MNDMIYFLTDNFFFSIFTCSFFWAFAFLWKTFRFAFSASFFSVFLRNHSFRSIFSFILSARILDRTSFREGFFGTSERSVSVSISEDIKNKSYEILATLSNMREKTISPNQQDMMSSIRVHISDSEKQDMRE